MQRLQRLTIIFYDATSLVTATNSNPQVTEFENKMPDFATFAHKYILAQKKCWKKFY